MTVERVAQEVFDREFLEMRAKVLELAASLDRIERSRGALGEDPRRTQLDEALAVLTSSKPNRAEQVQMIFSRTYEPNWREEFGV